MLLHNTYQEYSHNSSNGDDVLYEIMRGSEEAHIVKKATSSQFGKENDRSFGLNFRSSFPFTHVTRQ